MKELLKLPDLTILEQQNNKQKLQILKVLHIRKKLPKLNRINFKVKIPRYSHRLMHRKRVTCELHDSYFCLMTIKHVIPKTVEVHIPMASYGEILSGRWTII